MQQESIINRRKYEIFAGLFFILVVVGYLATLLFDFEFISPYTSMEEDLQYLVNNPGNSRTSTWLWLGTSGLTFLAAPLLFMALHRRLIWLHYLDCLLLLTAAGSFLMMGLTGFHLQSEIEQLGGAAVQEAGEEVQIQLLALFKQEQDWRYIGSSFLGLFAVCMAFSRIKLKNFPLLTSVLLILSGPVLIYFNWTDTEHVLRTAAMTGILIGIGTFSVRLINRGLS